MKTDVLYVCGPDANQELRWSLRSLAENARNVGRIVISGYIPEWVNRKTVRCVECPDISSGHKHVNILNCIVTAIERGAVKGDFQYSSDDHFLLQPTDLSAMPLWCKSGRLLSVDEIRANGVRETMYEAGLSNTKAALDKLGLRTDLFCVHRNTWMCADDLPRVRDIMAATGEEYINYGVEPTCAFMAARCERDPDVQLVRICDRKVYGFDEKLVETTDWLSTGDGMTDAMWNWLGERFAKPSKYEK